MLSAQNKSQVLRNKNLASEEGDEKLKIYSTCLYCYCRLILKSITRIIEKSSEIVRKKLKSQKKHSIYCSIDHKSYMVKGLSLCFFLVIFAKLFIFLVITHVSSFFKHTHLLKKTQKPTFFLVDIFPQLFYCICMLRLKNHYERAFGSWLADNAVNYVYVDQHKRQTFSSERVKTFDYLIYPPKPVSSHQISGPIVIAELKGKIHRSASLAGFRSMECWVSLEDIRGMLKWRQVISASTASGVASAVFVFAYKLECIDVENDGCEIYDFDGERYVFYCVDLSDYTDNMKLRSRRWQTVNLSAENFRQKAFPVRQLLAPESVRPYRVCY
jgi:hypothetical protein